MEQGELVAVVEQLYADSDRVVHEILGRIATGGVTELIPNEPLS